MRKQVNPRLWTGEDEETEVAKKSFIDSYIRNNQSEEIKL